MPLSSDVAHGTVTAFYLFDVGDALDLQQVRTAIGSTVTSRLSTRPATPTHLQYQQPPLALDGSVIGVGEVEGCRVRFEGVRLRGGVRRAQ